MKSRCIRVMISIVTLTSSATVNATTLVTGRMDSRMAKELPFTKMARITMGLLFKGKRTIRKDDLYYPMVLTTKDRLLIQR